MPADGPSRGQAAAAFAVHVFTAFGAALALWAMSAAAATNWPLMFLLLGLALVVDGIDGSIARKLRVAERLPRWSGDTLDLVVDFTTYVFVPAYAIATSGLLPMLADWLIAVAIVISGALYFADRNMKTADNYFRGFPTLWNAAAFYLFLLRPDPWIAAAALSALIVLTFVPVPFLHPFRVKRLRAFNALLIVAWAALAGFALLRDMSPGPWVTAALCAIALYILGAGILRRTEAE
jgi:phosphatidylcholine synthase